MKPMRLVSALVAVILVGPPSVALAQEDGVFYDPDSPAGKEYQLPLETTRRLGAGSPDDKNGSSAAGPAAGRPGAVLFGAGVVRGPAAGAGGAARGSTRAGGRRSERASVQAGADGRAPAAVSREQTRFERRVSASTGASPLLIGGSVVAGAFVLAAAAFAGRRWQTRRDRTA